MTETSVQNQSQVIQPLLPERLPYPSKPWLKGLFKSPILLYRLGWGPLVGKLFMVMTTTGRKSGQPRRTGIEYHAFRGRKYVMNSYGMRSDWYRNILSNPHVTVQTADGIEHCFARRITSDEELSTAYEFIQSSPMFRLFVEALGFRMNKEEFIAQKDRWCIVTFDPTNEPTPPPLEADLKWVNWVILGSFILGWIAGKSRR
jgi:deazaflavin-dependent oxidoreductase (nitroreductase family)